MLDEFFVDYLSGCICGGFLAHIYISSSLLPCAFPHGKDV